MMRGNFTSAKATHNTMGQIISFSAHRYGCSVPCVRDALSYLDAHFSEPISVDTLANALFISKYHLMREFKQATGQTIHAYLTKCRMQAAADMIASGVSIQETSDRVGYTDYSLFYKNFTRYAGVSPREYQQQAGGFTPCPCIQLHTGRDLLKA